MSQDIRDLAVFEKLTTVSRINSVFELLWHMDIEITAPKTVVNVLFRNVTTGEYITDEIAPEYLGYASVGSLFKAGKKLLDRLPTGDIQDITINVPQNGAFRSIDSVLFDSEYNLNHTYKTKDGRLSSFFAKLCKKQMCMVFMNGADKIVIPCSVIAATYYLTSHSMRVQLFAQNLDGLYEAIHFDPSTKAVLLILHRNARTTDAARIARFALSPHAKQCWDNVMNSMRSSSFTNEKNGRKYTKLIAKIPVAQQNLAMTVRCHEARNPKGGTTILVHEILKECSELPFKALYVARRGSAPSGPDTLALTAFEAKSDDKLTNKPPSQTYKGHRVRQFNIPDNPLWRELDFQQVTLPSRHANIQLKTITEQSKEETVSLSSQRAKGGNLKNKVAQVSLEQVTPEHDTIQRMTLTEFRDMADGFSTMKGVTSLYRSPDLEVPRKGTESPKRTLRESYDKTLTNRRHYLYVTFSYGGESVCLVEIDQTGLSTRIGTYVLVGRQHIGELQAKQAAKDFVYELSISKMQTEWLKQDVIFMTKSHPPNQDKKLWGSWRTRVLEMVCEVEQKS